MINSSDLEGFDYYTLEKNLDNITRKGMTFADVLWFLNKNKSIWGTMIIETLCEANLNHLEASSEAGICYIDNDDSTYQDVWNEALEQMKTWRQDGK